MVHSVLLMHHLIEHLQFFCVCASVVKNTAIPDYGIHLSNMLLIMLTLHTSWGASNQQGLLAKQIGRRESTRVGRENTHILPLPTGRALSQHSCPTDNHYIVHKPVFWEHKTENEVLLFMFDPLYFLKKPVTLWFFVLVGLLTIHTGAR